jgi:hypothetical protein
MSNMTWGENCPFCPPSAQCAHQSLLDQMETWDWEALLSEAAADQPGGDVEPMSEQERAALSARLEWIEAKLLERPDLWR